jgi:hypothetical protein
MSTPRRDIQPALIHLEAALEASCATLMALEASSANMRDGPPVLNRQIREAIASLREAIAEMRALHDVETGVLAFGFVLGAEPRWNRSRARRRQFKPRRTA